MFALAEMNDSGNIFNTQGKQTDSSRNNWTEPNSMALYQDKAFLVHMLCLHPSAAWDIQRLAESSENSLFNRFSHAYIYI